MENQEEIYESKANEKIEEKINDNKGKIEVENEEKTKAIKSLEIIENFFLNILDKIKLKFLADIYRNHLEGMRYLVFGALATIINLGVKFLLLFTISNASSKVMPSNIIFS